MLRPEWCAYSESSDAQNTFSGAPRFRRAAAHMDLCANEAGVALFSVVGKTNSVFNLFRMIAWTSLPGEGRLTCPGRPQRRRERWSATMLP